ncbi:hypothetical protein ACFQY0_19965 [Haloferula chungangensis]|uniref:Uncharacterized protein n=2 Tax=Haloferula chungangensis TaxID=1048331 RepID=A0ABW2LAJ6_9BACT
MVITPGFGVATARFGMTVAEALDVIGRPDQDFVDNDGDRCLCYNSFGMVLKFEELHSGRLGWLLVLGPEATLWGHNPFNMRFSELEPLLDARLNETKDREDYGYWGSTTWEDSWLEVQHALDRVQQINLGVRFDSEDNPLWPENPKAEAAGDGDGE